MKYSTDPGLPPGTPGRRRIEGDVDCPACGYEWTTPGTWELGEFFPDNEDEPCPRCTDSGRYEKPTLILCAWCKDPDAPFYRWPGEEKWESGEWTKVEIEGGEAMGVEYWVSHSACPGCLKDLDKELGL